MKKYLLLLFLFGVLSGYSQSDSERFAKKAFDSGNYNDAVQLYQAAIALTANATAKSELNQALSKARTCASLVQKAQTYLNAGNYSNAKKYYQALLVQNPADLNVQRQIDRCNQLIKTTAIKITNKKKRDAAYQKAISTGYVHLFQEFVNAYSNDEITPIFRKYIAIKSDSNYIPQTDEAEIYKRLGDIFIASENRPLARDMYDLAASVCDLEAMFKKALTYEKKDLEQMIKLLTIAAAGDYQPAKSKLANLKLTTPFNYNEKVAENYYKHLLGCTQSLESALYVAANAASYPLEHIHPDYSEIFKLTGDELAARKINDHLLYFIALKTGGERAANLMIGAAMQGNINASKWLGERLDKTQYTKQAAILKLCYRSFDKSFLHYLKYLKKESPIDWFQVYLYVHEGSLHGKKTLYDLHDELVALYQDLNYSQYKSSYKRFKDFLKLYSNKTWDAAIVAKCRSNVSTGRYTNKIIKDLEKLKTEKNLYNINDNPIWQFVQKGYFNNRHYYHAPTELLTISLHASSQSRPIGATQTSLTSRQENRPTYSSSNKTVKSSANESQYYVGQDLGVGYVFYVDKSGKHGLIVSKSYQRSSPGKVYGLNFSRSPGYKWRLPTANELYYIYDELKEHYPVATYLGATNRNLNFTAVIFNKKKCYNGSVNDSYTYCILSVAEF